MTISPQGLQWIRNHLDRNREMIGTVKSSTKETILDRSSYHKESHERQCDSKEKGKEYQLESSMGRMETSRVRWQYTRREELEIQVNKDGHEIAEVPIALLKQ